ncbi:hypothetical protein J4N42_16675 [Vibrio sp. SCSIO 43135]|uniref:hypothetical protein n=1 Tax=Vibrio sp. SCSIO 43135 TaxID=2819096 RepID=UPI00207663EB|nr:hypothetical protein [Vibrio sp. SCSIO 43135]USD43799.1 hypothetical protein J4N42_16675 [Vibrio sp. SCSIO 43135]
MAISKYALTVILTCCAAPASLACSYDGQFSNPFAESYEGALDVAIATQQAINSQSLHPTTIAAGKQGLRQVSWWLTVWTKQGPIQPDTFVYLVDSQLWSHFTSDSQMQIHSDAPTAKDSRVVMLSEAALDNLVKDNVSFDRALSLGIVSVR